MAAASFPNAVKESTALLDIQECAAELAFMPGLDAAAELRAHGLLAVADAEHGNAGVEDFLRRAGAADVDRRMRTAGQNNSCRLGALEALFSRLEGHDFRVHSSLADAARDELRDLAAEIDDEDRAVRRNCVVHAGGQDHRAVGPSSCVGGANWPPPVPFTPYPRAGRQRWRWRHRCSLSNRPAP